jgi:1,4-alpha-glucan branching enzyme
LSENPKTVAVAGDFSDWNTLQMEKKDGNSWVITLKVKPGKYQYSFVIDGEEWIPDPDSYRRIEDGFGGVNSVLVVNGG